MSKPNKQNFARAAFELCNDWRDTIGAGALTVAGGAAVGTGHAHLLHDLAWIAVVRETGRMAAWFYGRESNDSYGYAASAVNASLVIAVILAPSLAAGQPPGNGEAILAGMDLLVASSSLYRAGGPKGVWRVYKDKMWDYPRKQKPPKQRRRQKASAKLKALIEKMKDALAPQGPLPQPTRTMARRPAPGL